MSDGCHEEGRMTCSGCPKLYTCERMSEAVRLMKLKECYPEEYRKQTHKGKRRRKSAASLKVKRNG